MAEEAVAQERQRMRRQSRWPVWGCRAAGSDRVQVNAESALDGHVSLGVEQRRRGAVGADGGEDSSRPKFVGLAVTPATSFGLKRGIER